MSSPPSGSVSTRPLHAAITLIVSTLVALLGAELLLRLLPGDEYFVWPPNLERTFRAEPGIMPGVHDESRFVTNEHGIRGRPFSESDGYRILALGGSTTENLFLDESEAWPHLLEIELDRRFPGVGVWVGSVGKAGHTSRHHALQAEHLFSQYPEIDAALILVGLNDLALRLRWGPDFLPFAEEPISRQRRIYEQAFTSAPWFDGEDPVYKRTAIWRTLRRLRTSRSLGGGGVDQARGAGYVTRNRQYRQQAPRVIESLPDMTVALDGYRENLNRIVNALERQGVTPIFLTQPTMWREDLPPELERLLWFGESRLQPPGGDYYSVSALSDGMGLYNQVLLDVCRTRDVPCVDLAAALPKDTTVFYDDAHFNEPGARQVAQFLGAALAELGVGSEPIR